MRIGVLLFMASLMFFGGCRSRWIQSYSAPDGSTHQTVKCNQQPEKCFAAASESCDGGTYQVISSESHAGGLLADVLPGPVTWYGMTYACGPSDGRMPQFPFNGPDYVIPAPPPQKETVHTDCYKSGDYVSCTSQ